MDDVALSKLARTQGGVTTTAQMQALGLSRSGVWERVRSGRLFPVRRAAYTTSPIETEEMRWWAAVLTTDPLRAAISHWSALRVHRIWGREPGVVHVTVPRSGGRRAAGLVIHSTRRMLAADVVLVDGLRVTSPARTVLDIAPAADDQVVRRLIREAEQCGRLAAGEMRRAVDDQPRHPGAARVRRVDPETRAAALGQTPIEDELEAFVGGLPLPRPTAQFWQAGASGARYRFDFAWPRFRVAAEADGRSVHERSCALEDDRFRDNDVAAVGWVTLRFTRAQLGPGADESRRQLLSTAAARGWSP